MIIMKIGLNRRLMMVCDIDWMTSVLQVRVQVWASRRRVGQSPKCRVNDCNDVSDAEGARTVTAARPATRGGGGGATAAAAPSSLTAATAKEPPATDADAKASGGEGDAGGGGRRGLRGGEGVDELLDAKVDL